MMIKVLLVLGVIGMMLISASAFAHSGVNYNTTDPTEFELTSLTTQSFDHIDMTPFKGWWAVSLKNTTGAAWSSLTIRAGQNYDVAIVQSATPTDLLVDEFDFSGLSVTGVPAGAASYSGFLGTRTYDNGSTGLLWHQAIYTFNTPVNVGRSAKIYVYTDNSYYGTPATSFSLTVTPTVPEPGSILVLSTGVIGLAGFIRRRKN